MTTDKKETTEVPVEVDPTVVVAKETKPRVSKKDFTTFHGKIPNILHQVYPDLSLREETTSLINEIVYFIGHRIVNATNILLEKQDKKTLSDKEIETATKLTLGCSNALCDKARANGAKAVDSFSKATTDRGKPIRKETKSGLQIQVSKVDRLLIRNFSQAKRVGRTSGVYLTAVLESMLSEIFKLAGSRAMHQKRKQIRVNEIRDAICHDNPVLGNFFDAFYMGTVCNPEVHSAHDKRK